MILPSAPLLVSVCLSLVLLCSSQEVSEAGLGQTFAAETATAAQNSQWDVTPTAALPTTVQDARPGAATPRSSTSDYSTLFTNPWGPMLMPMREPGYGSRVPHHKRARMGQRERMNSKQFETLTENLTENEEQYLEPSEAEKYALEVPYIPYPPMRFRPAYMNRDAPEIPQRVPYNYPEIKEHNASASTQLPSYGVPNGIFDNVPMPYMNYHPYNVFLNNPFLVRNPETSLPSAPFMTPAGFYPTLPRIPNRAGSRQLYPELGLVNPFARPAPGERELAPVPEEAPREVVSPAETSDTSPARIVPDPFPPRNLAPYAPFPFGVPFPPPPAPFPVAPGIFPPAVAAIPPPQLLPAEPGVVEQEALLSGSPLQPPAEPPVVAEPAEPRTLDAGAPVFPPPPRDGSTVREGHAPYEFGYDSSDGRGTDQHRQESADENGRVTGSYAFKLPDDTYRVVNYVADSAGFRVIIKSNEPGVANPGSADAAVLAEPPPPNVIVESLRRSGIGAVAVPDIPADIEIEAKK